MSQGRPTVSLVVQARGEVHKHVAVHSLASAGRINVEINPVRAAATFHSVQSPPYPLKKKLFRRLNPYPTAFPYGNGMVLHFYQQQESSTTKTVHRVINKGLRAYVRGLLEKYPTVFFYANT